MKNTKPFSETPLRRTIRAEGRPHGVTVERHMALGSRSDEATAASNQEEKSVCGLDGRGYGNGDGAV